MDQVIIHDVGSVGVIATPMPEPSGNGQATRPAASVPAATIAEPAPAATMNDQEFADHLLHALQAMAERSKRRQADVLAALRGAKLVAELRQVRAALRLLQAQGDIENLVPLSDGGLLLTVRAPRSHLYGGMSPLMPGEPTDDLIG